MKPPRPAGEFSRRPIGPTVARIGAALLVVTAVVGIVGFLVFQHVMRSSFPPLPELERPTDVLERSVSIDPEAGTVMVHVGVAASREAVDAAATGDGLIHFELDVGDSQWRPVDVQIGVAWRESQQIIQPLAGLAPGADVRWTHLCRAEEPCQGTLELTFAPSDEQTARLDVRWRLVAQVRPPRGTALSEAATVSLTVDEDGE